MEALIVREVDILSDPEEGLDSTETILPGRRVTLLELIGEIDDATYVQVNGKRESDSLRVVGPGDLVEFARFPRAVVAGIAALIAAFPGTTLTLVALGVGVGLALAHRPKVPEIGTERYQSTPQSVSADGARVPLVFGERRVIGKIIESYAAPVFRHREVIGGTGQTLAVTQGDEEVPINTRVLWCKGPVDSVTEIRIDDNAIEDFDEAKVETVLGTIVQGPLEGFDEAKSPDSTSLVQLLVEESDPTPPSKTTTTPVDAVEIEVLFFEGLRTIDGTGFPQVRSVDVGYKYQLPDAPAVDLGTVVMREKSLAPVSRWIRIEALRYQTTSIEVYRSTADNVDPLIKDEFRFERCVEVVSQRRAYPGLAMTGIRMIPQKDSAAPQTYSGLVRGMNQLRIYSSTSSYTVGYSNNPAWVFMHLFGSPTDGIGTDVGYDRLTIQHFIDWAAYCTAQGMTCNWLIEEINAKTLYEAARVYDAWIIDDMGGGKIRVVIDEASPSVTFLGPHDFEIDSFVLEVAPDRRATRYIAAIPGDSFDREVTAVVYTSTAIPDGEGYVEAVVDLPGVTDKTQAEKALERAARIDERRTKRIQFTAGRSAMPIRAGEVFGIAAPLAGITLSAGQVLIVAGSGLVELAQPFTRESGKSYSMIHRTAGGTESKFSITPSFPVDTEGNWVDALSAPETIVPGDTYAIVETTFTDLLFRCEKRDQTEAGKISIVASNYDDSIYDASEIEVVTDPGTPSGVNPTAQPPVVQNVTLIHEGAHGIIVHWRPPAGSYAIERYEVWYSRDSGPYTFAGETRDLAHGIPLVTTGSTYVVRVRAVTSAGRSTSVADSASASVST